MWNADWTKAPKDKRFLVKYADAEEVLITTAAYFWETACGEVDGYDGQWWALHDMVRDCPLDDNGPPEDQGFEWMDLPQ